MKMSVFKSLQKDSKLGAENASMGWGRMNAKAGRPPQGDPLLGSHQQVGSREVPHEHIVGHVQKFVEQGSQL